MEPWVLNTKFESDTVVDKFESLIWVDRYNAYGDFELYLMMDPYWLEKLSIGNYLWLNESSHIMIVEKIVVTADVEMGNRLVVTGRSLESILERRIIWGQKSYSGSLQNAIEQMLNECIITPTIADRKIDNFIFVPSTDEKITSLTIDAQFTGDNLYDVIKSLCVASDIGFKIELTEDNIFAFSLYAGVDRSYEQEANPHVEFSPNFDNIINSEYLNSMMEFKNVTLVAGEGEGSDRVMSIVGSGSGLNRRELFTDARDISSNTDSGTLTAAQYDAKLQQRGKEKLAEYGEVVAFEGEAETTQMYQYGKDFFIGDIVQVSNEYGHEGRAFVSELIFSQNEQGISIYPTFETVQERRF